jgi:hypothetical protein
MEVNLTPLLPNVCVRKRPEMKTGPEVYDPSQTAVLSPEMENQER